MPNEINERTRLSEREEDRCIFLENIFNDFKHNSHVGPYIELDDYALYSAVVSYFEDVERYKQFHRITLINSVKCAGFTIKWIAKFRPVRFDYQANMPVELQYSNEFYALRCGLSFMRLGPRTIPPELLKDVLYTLRNRSVDERLLFIWLDTLKRAINGDFFEYTH